MNGKQLKNSILQWAIQGKLVPQDPNDEPASVLLEKIRTEKAQLVKEGKLKKKDLDVKPIAEDEIPFEIPKGWEWVRLNWITELIEDCPHSTAPDEGEGYPLIRTTNVGFGRLLLKGVHRVSESVYNKRNERAVPQENDLIYAREATAGNIAVIEEGQKVCLGQRTVLVRPMPGMIDSYWLAFFVLSPYSYERLVGKSTGTTVAHVNLADFRPYILPLPPLAKQHRIVAKIEELMPLVEKYGAAQETLDEWNQALPEKLKKSILQEAYFGNHVGIQLSETKEVKLKDVCDIIMGQSPEGNTYNNSNGIEFHQGKVAFGNMFLKPSGVFTTSPTKYAEPDSIVVSVRAPVGTANITKRKICIGRGLACVMPKQNADLMYIYYFLESPEIREYLEDNATGTTFKAISGKVLQELELTLPPLAEQRRIVAKIEELFGVLNK